MKSGLLQTFVQAVNARKYKTNDFCAELFKIIWYGE